MNDARALVWQARALGACFRVEGERLIVEGPSSLSAELMARLRECKAGIRSYLETEGQDSLFDLAFPMGYGGLPKAQVEAAEVVNDQFDIVDPIHRKYNVLVWVRGYYQDRGENHCEFYEGVKKELLRLGHILDREKGSP